MANIEIIDGAAAQGFKKATGAGTNLDPYIEQIALDSALPAGTNNIGDVDVLTLPALPAGTNNIGDVDVLSLPAIPAGSNLIGTVSGTTDTELSASYTRPADTTAYVDNDALSDSTSSPTALTFVAARANDISGYITNARLVVSHAAGSFTNELRLWLFRDSPTAINDNAAFTVDSAMVSDRPLAVITFSNWFTGGASSTRSISYGTFPESRLIPFDPSSGTDDIFGLVQVPTGFTPESAQTFEFYLSVESN